MRTPVTRSRAAVAEQPFDDGLVVDVDIGKLRHSATNGPFEQWSRHGRAVQRRRRSSLHATALVPEEVVTEVELDCACPDELVGESWEPLLEQPGAGDEQQVGMASLRHEATWLWAVGQGVAVEDDHIGRTGRPGSARRTVPPCWRRARSPWPPTWRGCCFVRWWCSESRLRLLLVRRSMSSRGSRRRARRRIREFAYFDAESVLRVGWRMRRPRLVRRARAC